MKIVTASRTQKDAKEMYKVGNIIADGLGYYLIVTSNKGYALVDLSNNSVVIEKASLYEIAEEAWDASDKLVDAELTIVK